MVSCACSYVPRCPKNFFKFWWDEELSSLKAASVKADRLWKASRRPRSGPIFDERQATRLRYRQCLREHQRGAVEMYTNDLHEALLHKDGPKFWKVWRSKFNILSKCNQVDGCVDNSTIAQKFLDHFASICTSVNEVHSQTLKQDFMNLKNNTVGTPLGDECLFDAELVGGIIGRLTRGKAAGLDGITAEHLQCCHPVLPCLLAKLFNLMFEYCYIPRSFGYSYIVPIPKPKDFHNKALTTDDFRGIAISSMLSKVYESCIYDRFQDFLGSSDNQFGFKKGSGCSHAIYSLRTVVNHFVEGGCTVNLCSIDLSKAFDKVDHYALFIKLMKRHVPLKLLDMLVFWLQNSWACVKWKSELSPFFKLDFGVRQGSILSPYLFAIYLDDIGSRLCFGQKPLIIIYADDIIIIAPSLCMLQNLLSKCEQELNWLGMSINARKSCCMRVGPRCDASCVNITTSNGDQLPWVKEIRYLGVYITQSRHFKAAIYEHKKSFFRSVNAIFGKIGRVAADEVILQLVFSKCMPVLLYGLEVLPLTKSDLNSLDFSFTRFLMKLFKTTDINVVKDCQEYFETPSPSELLNKRRAKFMAQNNNFICCYFFDSA